METPEAYLDRKHDELKLLNSCLGTPLALRRPASVIEAIEQKFRLAAALKAEHALQDWAFTETAWAHQGRLQAGPFAFDYDYQRADLNVRGPSFYPFGNSAPPHDTIYTASGMAAISALLLACVRLMTVADVLVLPHSYSETLELIESHVRELRMIRLNRSPDKVPSTVGRSRILLLDSCTSAAAFNGILDWAMPQLDLVVFDTTCFCTSSGRIGRVLSWARRWDLPIVLVRSHTKLDSLGVEYGRLGSAVFVACQRRDATEPQLSMTELAKEMRNAVRLLGGAAVPAHFPPYVGSTLYRSLTGKRVAAILRNSRRMARYFASTLPASSAELHFAHALYVTLAPSRMLDENQTKQIAEDLCSDMRKAGLLLRHAGSFGFDFGAAEWFRDSTSNGCVVRISVPDLPMQLWDEVAQAVVQWWSMQDQQKFRSFAAAL